MMKNIKRFLIAAAAVWLAAGMTDTVSAAVRLNKTNVKMEKGDNVSLKLKGKHGKASWRSSNKRVAAVNRKGKVHAKKKGRAVIICSADGKSYRCRVVVKCPGNTVAHAHFYEGKVTVEPTCISEGEKTFTCEECGDSYTVDLPMVPHSKTDKTVSAVKTVAPSKAGHGYTIYHCSVCGKDFEDDRVEYCPSQEQVYNDIMALKEQYPDGMKWDESNVYTSQYLNATGRACFAFALIVSDQVFGTAPGRYTSGQIDPSGFKVGDIVVYSYPSYHAVVVLETHPTYMVVAEGNSGGKVRWGRIVKYSDVTLSGFYSRY